VQGLPYLFNPQFYSPERGLDISILPQIFNTFYVLILAEIILIPIALAAAIYLVEYARQGVLVSIIHFAAETLAGVPSIVLGLFGFLLFGSVLQLGYSRLSGALALLCLNLPLALRLFEDALTSVPREFREGSQALGSTKWRSIWTVVLPSALPGIVTAIILTAGKILAESAVLIFTMGSSPLRRPFNLSPFLGGDTLTVRIWYVEGPGSQTIDPKTVNAVAAGSAAVIIIILLLINIGARALGRVIERRVTAA
jgi:phosphate transport system permease protein